MMRILCIGFLLLTVVVLVQSQESPQKPAQFSLSPAELDGLVGAGLNRNEVENLIKDANEGAIYQNDNSNPHSGSLKAASSILQSLQAKMQNNFKLKLDSLEDAVSALAIAKQKEADAKTWLDDCQKRYDQAVVKLEEAVVALQKAREEYEEAVRLRKLAQAAYDAAVVARAAFEKNMKAEEELVKTIHDHMLELNSVKPEEIKK